MPSRDIHSRDGGKNVRDLLVSFFSTMLLSKPSPNPMYLISPWLSDFRLLDNEFGQFKDLFKYNAGFSEKPYLLFSEILIEVSWHLPIRIVTWPDDKSKTFIKSFENKKNIQVKLEKAEKDHQKGLLTDLFYFEGSMNFTYSGVYRNQEKITCNASFDPQGKSKIGEAYLEFDRIWDKLELMDG